MGLAQLQFPGHSVVLVVHPRTSRTFQLRAGLPLVVGFAGLGLQLELVLVLRLDEVLTGWVGHLVLWVHQTRADSCQDQLKMNGLERKDLQVGMMN